MNEPISSPGEHFFRQLLQWRSAILAGFVVLGALGAWGATRIPDDHAIGSLMVADDPDARATARFEQLFPEGVHALLMLESADPLDAASLQGLDRLERVLGAIPGVHPQSALTIWRGAHPGVQLSTDEAGRVRSFVTGTGLFRRAGLVGDHFVGLALELDAATPADRNRELTAVDAATAPLLVPGSPFSAVRKVGSPWLDAWLEHETARATQRSMPLFGIFLVTLIFALYRSWRAVLAIVITLSVVVAMAVGLAALTGWPHTIVSALVPLTVLITATATLVYIHSRYVEGIGDALDDDLRIRQARVLANKFLPCTASIFATAVGFAALAVSSIRPVREMGLWTACGLIVAWLAAFTLFPALQALLHAPVRARGTARALDANRYSAFVDAWLPVTRRLRWLFVGLAVLGMAAGIIALTGLPGRVNPMALQTDTLTYIDPTVQAAQDTRRFEATAGLAVYQLWLRAPAGTALDPALLRAVDQLRRELERDPRITAVDGPTAALRWMRYLQSGQDQLPTDPAAWDGLASDLQQMLLTNPDARGYVDLANLSDLRLTVRGRDHSFDGLEGMRRYIEQTWRRVQAAQPDFKGTTAQVVGQSVLSDQITLQLVPTLMESFALTASIIFCAFLLVFRSPLARLMAMIPSLFAILAACLVMRACGIPLNIATILIGSTVLGATENDQVHFFYHYQEGRAAGGGVAAALRHALLVAGRPVLFATLINAGGFLALALSPLPPMRQFGIVSSSAFVLALLADFTALPAALWLCEKRR